MAEYRHCCEDCLLLCFVPGARNFAKLFGRLCDIKVLLIFLTPLSTSTIPKCILISKLSNSQALRDKRRQIYCSKAIPGLEKFPPDSLHYPPSHIAGRTGNYIRSHPDTLSIQVISGVASIASLVAIPVLRAVGFAATGPVAGSVAAA
ncbi:hypothetical protein NHQ30_007118 [Ciborinia camelliae]|nr:hypothetical protein NHQ30_007118 [Ciborinia camelliae]